MRVPTTVTPPRNWWVTLALCWAWLLGCHYFLSYLLLSPKYPNRTGYSLRILLYPPLSSLHSSCFNSKSSVSCVISLKKILWMPLHFTMKPFSTCHYRDAEYKLGFWIETSTLHDGRPCAGRSTHINFQAEGAPQCFICLKVDYGFGWETLSTVVS